MSLMLLYQLMLKEQLSHGLLITVVRSLNRKIGRMIEWPQTQKNMAEFILAVWQRYADHFDQELVMNLL